MSLVVIGAGFGRTGTFSVKLALEVLGLGPCHHMESVLANPDQLAIWRGIASGARPDWTAIYRGFRSAVDWPTAHYWQDLSRHFPEARILLTYRDADRWYDSFAETILRVIGPDNDPASFGVSVISNIIFSGQPEDRARAIAAYHRHNEHVRATVPPERLICHEVGQGWQPLCEAFGLPLPDQPFPRTNSTDEFKSNILKS